MADTDGNVLPFPDRFTHLITHVIGIVDRAAKECLAYGGPEALSAFRMVNLNDLVQECGSTSDAVSQILDAMMAITGTRDPVSDRRSNKAISGLFRQSGSWDQA
jgi:hypothetical protein